MSSFFFKRPGGGLHYDKVNAYKPHRCPRNKAEWKDREIEFNCPETNKEDVYHCVLNSKGTKFLEVCAPVVNIQGN